MFYLKHKYLSSSVKRVLFSLLILGMFSGCGMWTNFKTYFNTYYNANKIFEETEEKLLTDRTELFYFEEEPTPKNLSGNFDQVIEKTSAILQHNKESDYVEIALLMTGKSFFYQQNYSRALRKFNELASLPDSEFALENKLWIGKSYLKLREFSKALRILDEVKNEAITNEEDDILNEMYISKIGYLIYNEEYENAVTEINELLESDINDELRAEVYYELGLLNQLTKNFEDAEKAFLQVDNYSPSFDVDYNSKFEIAKLKRELGDIDKSLELLNILKDEDKFSDNWDQIDLEMGKIYYDRNEIDEAFDKFTEVDTTYKKTEASSVARFYRAEILENFYHDYDSALVLYKAASSSTTPEELRFLAQKKSGLLNKYIAYHDKLDDLELQILYLTEPQKFIEDSLEYVEKVRLDSIKNAAQGKTITKRAGSRNKPNTKFKQPKRPKISVDSLHALNSKNYFELANLLFSEFDDPDSAYYYYTLSLDEKENNPNQAQTYFSMGNYFLIKEDKRRADSMFTLVYDKFEFDPIRNEAAKQLGKPLYDFDKDPVEEEYVKAEEIYYSSNYVEAIEKLYDIYKENPKSIYASKSLYTIGYIFENDLDLPDSAASVYGILNSKYRTSEYAKAIQIKYTGHKQEQERLEAEQDSTQKTIDKIEKELPIAADNLVSKAENEKNNETMPNDDKSNNTEKAVIIGSTPEVEAKNVTESTTPKTDLINPTEDIAIAETSQENLKTNDVNNELTQNITNEGNIVADLEIPDSTNSNLNNDKIHRSNESIETRIDEQKESLAVVSRDIFKDETKYYVQISSWKTKEIAESELQKLTDKKYNAFIIETYVEDLKSVYHRVRVGPYSSFQAAKKVRLELNGY